MTDKQPKIELKAIKILTRASEETLCFEATMYVNHKCYGKVSNRGKGGAHQYQLTDGEYLDLNELVQQTFPEVTYEDPHTGEVTHQPAELDDVITGLALDFMLKKELRTLLKQFVIFERKGKVFKLGYKRKAAPDALLQAKVLADHRDAQILNNLPFDDALCIYAKATTA